MYKKGFTLAEVLITLGIIGVVAAMTIPTLVQNYKKKIVETKLKKVYSIMNQAIKMSTVENGDTTTWKFFGASSTSTATYEDALEWYNTYLADYLKTQNVEKKTIGTNDYLCVYLMDGSVLAFTRYIYDIRFYLNAKDIGNDTEQKGKTYFNFRFLPKPPEDTQLEEAMKNSYNNGFAAYTYDWDGTYEGTKNSPNGYGCFDTGAQGGSLCTKLIELNGWKIPDDYPIKF